MKVFCIPSLLLCCALAFAVGCGDRDAPSRPDAGTSDDAGTADAGTDGGTSRKKAVGEACAGPTDCQADASCIGSADGTFICMATCDEPYAECSGGSVCTPVSDGLSNICYIGGSLPANEDCTSNLQCASGLLCFGTNAEFYCREACQASTGLGCLPGEFCRPLGTGAGICRATLGSGCATNGDCPAGLVCSTEFDTVWSATFPGGYCTTPCNGPGDCSIGSRCVSLPATDQMACVRDCDHVSDCRFNESYKCVAPTECAAYASPEVCEALTEGGSTCLP